MKISFVLMLRKEKLRFVTRPDSNAMCMIKIFIGGLGVVNGKGGNSERCFKWGTGGHKKLFVRGEDKEGATTVPPPPLKV